MENLIKVSVLMPVYNAEKYIVDSIESILNQTFSEFEFIIIDDNSNDSSWKIIKEYVSKDKRISAFRNENNLGISNTRNKALSLAVGEYIIWQDSDDISVPNRIEKQLEFMESHPEVAICGGFLQFFNENKNLSIRKYYSDDELIRKYIFRFSPVSQGAAIVRKECFKEVGVFDHNLPYAEDLDMSFRIGTRHKFANIPEILLKYRIHNNSSTLKRLKSIELKTINIRRKYSVGYGYNMTLIDKIYNFLQFLSIFIFPTKFRIWLFDLIRNSR